MNASSPPILVRLRDFSLRSLAWRPAERVGGRATAALALCHKLLGETGEATGTQVAASLAEHYAAMDAAEALVFYRALVDRFAPPVDRLAQAARDYLERPASDTACALTEAAEPPRQELLRRLNMAPGGTALIVGMRAQLLGLLGEHPELAPLESDLRHLLASWFNRGFLEIAQIDWQSPAAVLEKLMRYEAVHEIRDWEDLRRRLQGDRRCFAFFHPALPGEPIIFVEVALTDGISNDISSLLAPQEGHMSGAPRGAIFYSISNCQPGLRSITFGNFLIKQVVADLKAQLPSLKVFATLSPIPGFRRWLDQALATGLAPAALAGPLAEPAWWETRALSEPLRKPLLSLCAAYLTGMRADGSLAAPRDPVARFHLSNGARLERLDWKADLSPKGIRESWGLMVNYRYLPRDIEANHEAFVSQQKVARSREIDSLIANGPPRVARRADRSQARG